MSEVTLRVDWLRCSGHGLCADMAPEVIEKDDWGFPVVAGDGVVPHALLKIVNRAVDACPAAALVLERGGVVIRN
jgi:ferredoxin